MKPNDGGGKTSFSDFKQEELHDDSLDSFSSVEMLVAKGDLQLRSYGGEDVGRRSIPGCFKLISKSRDPRWGI